MGETEEQESLIELKEIIVDKGQAPERIDKYILNKLENISRNRIQNALKAGAITLGDKEIKANYKVRPLDHIKLVIPRNPDFGQRPEPEDIPLDIVFEDEYLLVVNKPAGLVVHPGVGNRTGTLVNALMYHLGKNDMPVKEGNDADRPGLVHRIDKNTSGLLVVAKTELAMTHLAKQFFDHKVERSYNALIWGEPEEDGTVNALIGRDPKNRIKMKVVEDEDSGKVSITHYKMIEPFYYVSLVECRLETGRTHQIRVHMSSMGHPVFNDDRYGGDRVVKGTIYTKYKQFVQNCFKIMPYHALHANTLGFVHPITGKNMRFEAELPPLFQELVTKWRNYILYKKEN